MSVKEFPRVKGVIKKWTKSGQRFLLHGKDLSGKDIYVTVPIEDTDTEKEYFDKIRNARIKLIEKKNRSKIEDLVDEYIGKKQLSDGTAKNVRLALKPYSLDNQHNINVTRELLSGRLKPSTAKTKIGYIRSFFRWLITSRRINDITDPTQDFCVKCPPTHRSRVLTPDEESRLVRYIDRLKNIEHKLILRLALFTGARISSICELTPSSLKDGRVYLYNVKCKKPYDYPIPIKDKETIRLFDCVSSKLSINDKLFVKPVNVYANCLDKKLLKLFGRDNNGESISIHSLRHTFATKAIQRGVPAEIVSRLLDHSSPATTLRIYARHSAQQLEEAVDKIFK